MSNQLRSPIHHKSYCELVMQTGSGLCWTMSFLPSLTFPGHMPQVETPDRYAVKLHCHLLAALQVLVWAL